jgi:CheY-like chemotaxis protein
VVLNLCVNARDAMSCGGKLTVTSSLVTLQPQQAMRQQCPPESRYVLCTVSDTGVGIAPEVLPRIFDPFYTTKEEGKGTGLGLSIAHDAIVRAGGFIEVESELGKGTTMRVYFPAVDAGVIAPARVETPVLGDRIGSVLVVDDLELIRDFTESLFTHAGYSVKCAKDAPQALALLEQEPFDLLFTDNKMPGMSGAELIEKAFVRWPKMKSILASGHIEETLQRQLQHRYGARILKKPYQMNEALKLVNEILGRPAA